MTERGPVSGGDLVGGGAFGPTGEPWRSVYIYNRSESAPVVITARGNGEETGYILGPGGEDEIEGRIERVTFSSAPITWRAS